MKKALLVFFVCLSLIIVLSGQLFGYWSIFPKSDFVPVDAMETDNLVYNITLFKYENEVAIGIIKYEYWHPTEENWYPDDDYSIYLLSNESEVLYSNTFHMTGRDYWFYIPYDPDASKVYVKNSVEDYITYKNVTPLVMETLPAKNQENSLVIFMIMFLIVVMSGALLNLSKKSKK